MPRNPGVDPSAFFMLGGSTGVLLIHGFSGSPAEMRPLGVFLAAQGYTVLAPLLDGHGATPEAMRSCRWQDWRRCVEDAWEQLGERCSRRFVAGLSMGGALALLHGAAHPETAGIIGMAPAIRFSGPWIRLARWAKAVLPYLPAGEARHLGFTDPEGIKQLWSYEKFPLSAVHQLWLLAQETARALPGISAPLLLLHGDRDPAIPGRAAQTALRLAGSADKRLIWVPNSGHCITVDSGREFANSAIAGWLREHER